MDEGLILDKVTTPIGVVAVIFESRPDALVQISTLCLKSGNAVILKGGSEAKETNSALAKAIVEGIMKADGGFKDAVQLLSTREQVRELLDQDDLVDLIVPRGSNQLGPLHPGFHQDPGAGTRGGRLPHLRGQGRRCRHGREGGLRREVPVSGCLQRYGDAAGAQGIAKAFLPRMAKKYSEAHVEIRGDERTRELIHANEPRRTIGLLNTMTSCSQ